MQIGLRSLRVDGCSLMKCTEMVAGRGKEKVPGKGWRMIDEDGLGPLGDVAYRGSASSSTAYNRLWRFTTHVSMTNAKDGVVGLCCTARIVRSMFSGVGCYAWRGPGEVRFVLTFGRSSSTFNSV